jgi:hypothetical protein
MQANASKRFEVIRNVDDPGPYLLQEFCKPEKRAFYRPSKTFAQFFAESDDIVLHARYIWVYVESLENLEKWTEFVSDYAKKRGKNKETAVFILEWKGERVKVSKKGIKTLSFDDYINEYDRIVFSMLASSSVREEVRVKNYLAELASDIAGNDIELCAACLKDYKLFLKEPFKAVQHVIGNSLRSNGEIFLFNGTADDVKHYVWQAQIRTIYPLLEEFREIFVSKHESAIEKELPITSSYGEIYDDPKDVELGTLVFMADNGRLQLKPQSYFKLKRFKEARNKLSHLDVLTEDEIRELLQ